VSTRITIDPVTRIEGHLRVDCEINGGKVTKAWSSGQMWRGVELILLGRDPRDAWTITQRICGVCTTVHAIASVRAVENALQLEVPLNAQYIRNMIVAAHAIHDHIVHFYHLSALDFVDVVSALKADPVKAAAWIEQYSDWPLNGKEVMKQTQEKLKSFVGTGQLGPFTNGYWGHPAMKLTPEINLVAVTHYLQALDIQRQPTRSSPSSARKPRTSRIWRWAASRTRLRSTASPFSRWTASRRSRPRSTSSPISSTRFT